MNTLGQSSKDGQRWDPTTNQNFSEKGPTQDDKIVLVSEFIKGRLYFAVLRSLNLPACSVLDHFFCTDRDFIYNSFNRDFGPLSLSSLIRYCFFLKNKLCCPALRNKRIVHCSSLKTPELRANASYLISAFAVICLGREPTEALAPLLPKNIDKKIQVPSILQFRDASLLESPKKIDLSDCLYALQFAMKHGFFDPNDFDVEEYENLSNSKNINWVVPHRLLAFVGPQDKTPGLDPNVYADYFKENGVSVVVRLNRPLYNELIFTKVGIHHVDLFFPDGTPPPIYVVKNFLKVCDEAEAGKWSSGLPGAIAVHCKAGLGRTGALIASRLISRYGMRAKMAVAWLRICRPGCVMSAQQDWLEGNEGNLLTQCHNRKWKNKQASRDDSIPSRNKQIHGIYSVHEKQSMPVKMVTADQEKKRGEPEENEEVLHTHTYDEGKAPAETENKASTSLPQMKTNKQDQPKKSKLTKKKQFLGKRTHS